MLLHCRSLQQRQAKASTGSIVVAVLRVVLLLCWTRERTLMPVATWLSARSRSWSGRCGCRRYLSGSSCWLLRLWAMRAPRCGATPRICTSPPPPFFRASVAVNRLNLISLYFFSATRDSQLMHRLLPPITSLAPQVDVLWTICYSKPAVIIYDRR